MFQCQRYQDGYIEQDVGIMYWPHIHQDEELKLHDDKPVLELWRGINSFRAPPVKRYWLTLFTNVFVVGVVQEYRQCTGGNFVSLSCSLYMRRLEDWFGFSCCSQNLLGWERVSIHCHPGNLQESSRQPSRCASHLEEWQTFLFSIYVWPVPLDLLSIVNNGWSSVKTCTCPGLRRWTARCTTSIEWLIVATDLESSGNNGSSDVMVTSKSRGCCALAWNAAHPIGSSALWTSSFMSWCAAVCHSRFDKLTLSVHSTGEMMTSFFSNVTWIKFVYDSGSVVSPSLKYLIVVLIWDTWFRQTP